MILRHVRPEDVRLYWPKVKEGLAKLPPREWSDEDAYHLLGLGVERGGAMLSLIADDGFMITQRYPGDDMRGMLFVLAMAAYEPGSMLKHYPKVYEELDEMARQLNCRLIRHISPHKEWGALDGKYFKLSGYVYQRFVGPVGAISGVVASEQRSDESPARSPDAHD